MSPFAKNKQLLQTVDAVAKRYGRTPAEIVDVSLQAWSFNLACAKAGIKADNEARERAARRK